MQVQRVQNNSYNQQFGGILTLKETYWNTVEVASKGISKEDDKKLYDMFVKFIGEEPEKFASQSGGAKVSKNAVNECVDCVNKLLKTNIKMEQEGKGPFLYHYSSDGKGNLKYTFGFLNDPYSITHELHR